MLRQRVPSAIVMTLGLLAVMWLDAWAAGFGVGEDNAAWEASAWWRLVTGPGWVMLFGLLVPAVWLASREVGVLMHAVGIGAGPRGRVVFAGAAAGLLMGVWPGVVALWTGPRDPGGVFLPKLIGPGFVAVGLGWLVLWLLRRERSAAGAIHLLCALSVGIVFLGLLVSAWFWVRVFVEPWGLAAAVLVIKSCDIGAYFTGRFLGRRKLIVWLSPGKTWEGLAGGLLMSSIVCVLLSSVWSVLPTGGSPCGHWPWWYAALAGALLGYVGQLGDLFASALKRDAGVKDFARTIPGFGGVMDVIDSLLLAGPVVLGLVWLGGMLA